MRRFFFPGLAALLLATLAGGGLWWWQATKLPDTESLALSEIVYPKTAPAGLVLLLSDTQGYREEDAAVARKLAEQGAIVVGIDTPRSYAKIDAAKPDCVYIIGEVEALSQEVQRRASDRLYRNPIIAGARGGGSLALALAAQTPDASVGGTVAADPGATLPMQTELCTEAPHSRIGSLWRYGLEDGRNPDPITVLYSPTADPDGRQHVADIVAEGHSIATAEADGGADAALVAGVAAMLQKSRQADAELLGDLPLAVLPAAAPSEGAMAIVLSGDGGWRDLDREIARVFAEQGVPTIGIDSMRYFWAGKPPAKIAADLDRIISVYGKRWNASRILLIGYSFGADVLPQTFPKLPPELQSRIAVLSLLAPTGSAEYQFRVGGLVAGWFGLSAPVNNSYLPDLKQLPLERVQCVYGAEDSDSPCRQLSGTAAEIIETQGGHHFDGDYPALARRILARLLRPVG